MSRSMHPTSVNVFKVKVNSFKSPTTVKGGNICHSKTGPSLGLPKLGFNVGLHVPAMQRIAFDSMAKRLKSIYY